MTTNEQEKQLKKLLVEQKKKSNDLKRLKAEQAAKKRYREIKKVFRTNEKSTVKSIFLFSVKSKLSARKILN